MSEAKIEVFFRPIQNTEILNKKAPQHSYIVYTNSFKEEICIRGGPETNHFLGMIRDNIKVTKEIYKEGHIDYYDNAYRITIATGTDGKMQGLMDTMWKAAESINAGNFDYKLPTLGHQQNSNTVVRALLDSVGIKTKGFSYEDGTPILLPSFDSTIKHTFADLFLRGLEEARKIHDPMEQLKYFRSQSFESHQQQSEKPREESGNEKRGDAPRKDNTFSGQWNQRPGSSDEGSSGEPGSGSGGNGNSGSGPGGSGSNSWFHRDGFNDFFRRYENIFEQYQQRFDDKEQTKFKAFREDSDSQRKSYDFDWIYRRSSDFKQEWNSYRQDFRSKVGECLRNPFCNDNLADMMKQSAGSFSDYMHFKNIAEGEARYYFRSRSWFDSTLGDWIHPLRNELRYAASHVSPLVLDLDCDGIRLHPYDKGVYFDIDNDGFSERVGWPDKSEGQLARDISKNGIIDDITELFGDDLIAAFFKLSLLDDNNDGVLDAQDANFGELLIWQDLNHNGYSESDELQTLSQYNISSISLRTNITYKKLEGNIITETANFTYQDGRQCQIADVHYHNDDMDSWYSGVKVLPKVDYDKFAQHIATFNSNVVSALMAKLKALAYSQNDVKEDWVLSELKAEVKKIVSEYKADKDRELEEILSLSNTQYRNKKSTFESYKFIAKVVELQNKAAGIYERAKNSALTKLFKNHQEQLKTIKDNINSQYLQQYNKERTNAFNEFKRNLKEENELESKRLLNRFQGVQNGQAAYEAAAKEAFKANDKRLKKDYDVLCTQLKEKNDKQANRDIAIATLELRTKVNKKQEEIKKLFMKEFQNSFIHRHGDDIEGELASELQGLRLVIQKQFDTYKTVNEQEVKEFERAIKSEANKIYVEWHNETVPLINGLLCVIKQDESCQEPKINASNNVNQTFNNYSKFNDILGIEIDLETLFMPLMRGYGKVPALHIAMTQNPILKKLVSSFMFLSPEALSQAYLDILNILYEWAGVSKISDDSMATADGVNIEAKKIAFLEQVTGQEFKQLGAASFVGQHASTAVQKAFDIFLIRAIKNLLVQGPLAELFPKAEYEFYDDNVRLNSSLDEILTVAESFASEHELQYNFWVQLGYILALSLEELDVSIAELQSRLSSCAGQAIMVSTDTFSLIGDEFDNIIHGTMGSDYIKGLGGDDKLYGKEGSDHLEGGEGDDELYGDDGIDRIYGNEGYDKIYGGSDRDFLYGGDGIDEIYGEDGDDMIEGGAGPDYLDGGEGENTLSYGSSERRVTVDLRTCSVEGGDAEGDTIKNFQNLGGSEHGDTLIGDDNNNFINGEGGDDSLYGDNGNDRLFGATGKDYLYGGAGDDTLSGFEGEDHMDGGDGIDTATYHHPYATSGVRVDLMAGTGSKGYAAGDTYINIENIEGSKHRDTLLGDDNDNILHGHEGDDTIRGRDGNDKIIGGAGDNRLFGDEGNDYIFAGSGSDELDGGLGEDTLHYTFAPQAVKVNMTTGTTILSVIHRDTFKDFENIVGSNFNDEILGDSLDNKLYGLKGSDIIRGGKGNDFIRGGEDADHIDGGDGTDIADYSDEVKEGIKINLKTKTAIGGTAQGDKLKNIEGIVGTKFNDVLVGDDENNLLFGEDGDDELNGGHGNDQLSGGFGKNILNGSIGIDLVSYAWLKQGVGINVSLAHGESAIEGLYKDIYFEIEGVIGSRYNDTIIGDDNNNYLYGGDGDDYIDGGDWNDKIFGGEGNNALYGGSGKDEFMLVEGANKVDGGEGEDTINYASFNAKNYVDMHTQEFKMRLRTDLLPEYPEQTFVTPVVEVIPGLLINLATSTIEKPGQLFDIVINIENVIGTNFDDTIIGDDNNNNLVGTNGNDKIYGGKGNDTIVCGQGASILDGGEGNDRFIIKGFPANIDGGEGVDSVDFVDLPVPIEANLKDGYAIYNDYSSPIKSDLKGIESIRGTSFNDILHDSDANNIIAGGRGNDHIYLTNGDDSVNGEIGKDVIYLGGEGNKQIWGGEDSDTFVITKDFRAHNKTSSIIVDFDTSFSRDKIDLREFDHLKAIEDLNLEQLIHNNQLFTTIELDQNKWLSLYSVNVTKLTPSNFIFADEL